MQDLFQISAGTALKVVLTTVCIYAAFILLVRFTGPRALTSTSSFDYACIVAFGAILGRTVLLTDPTLAIGLVALGTFFAMQAVLSLARESRLLDRLLNPAPILLVADGELMTENMRRAHVVEDEIRQAARRAGARGLAELRCVVLERNGSVSVVRGEEPVASEPWLLLDVSRRSATQGE